MFHRSIDFDKLKQRKKNNITFEKISWAFLRFFLWLTPQIIARELMAELSKRAFSKFSKEELRDLKLMLYAQQSQKGFITDLDHDLPPALITQIECPTLIVHSVNDAAVSTAHANHAKEEIPNAKVYWVDNERGHLVWIGDKSEATIQKIRTFLMSPNTTLTS